MGILSLLIWTPAFGIFLILLTPPHKILLIRQIALFTAAASVLLAIHLASRYDPLNAGIQFSEHFLLNQQLGNSYDLGIDGLSLPMILLTGILTSIALISTSENILHPKAFYCCVLFLEMGLLGVFLTQDWTLFYVFWATTLIPLFFLIDRWGGERRHAASLNFALYALASSLFILVSLFALGEYMPEQDAALMTTLGEAVQMMPKEEQILVLIGFLIGFGVKLPIVPFHGWLPLVHSQAPTPVNILISGVILKMGAYGLLRVSAMLPVAVEALQSYLLILALFNMLYGGLLAWRQNDLKAMLAYASISQMGLVLLGIAAMNLSGLTGAVLQMTAHGLITAALFLSVGLLEERAGSSNIREYSSLSPVMPRFAIFTTLSLLALMGLPGSVGFIAQLHTFIGSFERWGSWMIFFSASILICAAYCIRSIGLLFMGPTKPNMLVLQDIHQRELSAASLLAAGIIWVGFFPTSLIDLSVATLAQINSLMSERVL